MKLKKLTNEYNESVIKLFMNLPHNETGFQNTFSGKTKEECIQYLEQLVENSLGKNLKNGHVPQTTFILFKDDTAIGLGRIRHKLNDSLLACGGHIAYYIIPEERQKGYGSFMFKKLIEQSFKMGIEKILVTCDKDNYKSLKMIKKQNGIQDNSIRTNILRFWI